MTGHLFWIIPPVVGAFIGYVTNLVAIKMLFRPLEEKRIFSLRLPFTPGILPKERGKLAASIGRMVEEELFTAEVLRERLKSEEVSGKINGAIDSYSRKTLERPLLHYLEETSPEISPLEKTVKDFLNSDIFDSFLDELLEEFISKKSPLNFLGFLVKDSIKNNLLLEIRKNRAPGESSSYRRALERIAEKYPGISLGEFLSIGKQKKRFLDSFAAEKAMIAIEGNIENALSSVNVSRLVEDRINSLDMIKVEKIVIDVMAGQLKWINIFGGIIGALIGFVQVLLSLFTR